MTEDKLTSRAENFSDWYNQLVLKAELADVMLYLLQLASLADIDLEKAVLSKLKKNYHRSWDVTE